MNLDDNRPNFGNRGLMCRRRTPVTTLGTPANDSLLMSVDEQANQQSEISSQQQVYGPHLPPGQGGGEEDLWTDELQDGSSFSGSIPASAGMASVVRIPIPGTQGMAIELSPRGWVPKGGSSSTLFIQDPTGKHQLRLDYGYNAATQRYDYHWNLERATERLGLQGRIQDHAPVGRAGQILHQGARYYRVAGRVFLVVGIAADVHSIVVAKKRVRQVLRVTTGWAGMWAGCQYLGAWGAGVGSAEPGLGTAIGGGLGCIVGGWGGYNAASWATGEVYDLVEETFFEPVPEIPPPQSVLRQ